MSFSDLVKRAWEHNVLLSGLLELTYACNWDCEFCYNDRALRGRTLSVEQYAQLFADLRQMQALYVILSGGEPLVHRGFFDIALAAREHDLAVRIKTNGELLTPEVLRRLSSEIEPMLIELSLHGARPETHDRQTRRPGSLSRLLDNIARAAAAGLRLKLNSTLTRYNETEIEQMYELADALSIPLQFDPEVTPRDDGDRSPLSIAPSPEGLARLFEVQMRLRGPEAAVVERPPATGRPSRRHCGAGGSTIAVDPYGTVYPCVQWRRPLGSLHEQTLAEIWSGSAVSEIREVNEEVARRLSSMSAPPRAFCPGAAEASTESPFGISEATRRWNEATEVPIGARALPIIP